MDNNFYNSDAEVSLLSCLLRNSERVYSVIDGLKGHMFSAALHEIIFNSIIALYEKNYPINSDSLKMQLINDKNMDQAGGPEYVDMLSSSDVDDAGFDLYLRSVVDNYKARQLLTLSTNLPVAVKKSTDISDLLANVRVQLDNLSQGGLRDDVHTIEQLLADVWVDIEKRIQSPGIKGITTGIKPLDDLTGGLCSGDVWVIGARPSMGKTTILLKMLLESAQSVDAPSLMISKEMNGSEIIERMLSMDSGVSATSIKFGYITDEDKTKLKRSANNLKNLPIYIDSNYYGDINYIVSVARKFKKQRGIKLLGIDYIQLLAERGDNQTAELGRIMRALKLLANDLDICVVIASQLNRLVELREDKHPILSDFRQSGNIEEDADVALSLYRDEVYNKNPDTQGKIDVTILKQRDGPLGSMELAFDTGVLNIHAREFNLDLGIKV